MKKDFSKHWKSSKSPRKQRKYLANAPLHIRRKFLTSTLSRDLRKKHKKRSFQVVTDDKVKILRGQFKSKEGKITSIDIKKSRVYIDSIQLIKKDGTKLFYPVHPSNLMILELNTKDKERMKIFERIKNVAPQKT